MFTIQDIDPAEALSTYELSGLASLAQWLQADVAKYLGETETNPDVQKQIRHDIPSSVSDPKKLVTELISGVEKVVAKRLAMERGPEMPETESKYQSAACDSPKVKLKLTPSTNGKKLIKDQSPTPKVILKVKPASRQLEEEEEEEEVVAQDLIRDDDYYELSNGEELSEDDILRDDLDLNSSDDEYQSEEEHLASSGSTSKHRQRSKPRANTRRKLKRDTEPEDSSSDDDLGTTSSKVNKKQRFSAPPGRTVDVRKGKKMTTVKQRLLERVIKSRR
ncbi:hypothetical protein BX666DRAFT_766679 [Dichotomocladium elegans]|nr:hypothetical protein BX666DRAFT_766679 [Dichotomocladium elegans]